MLPTFRDFLSEFPPNFRRLSAGRAGWAVADDWRRLLRRSVAGQVSSSTGARRKKLLRRELLT